MRRQFTATYAATLGEAFAALSLTLAFRRWVPADELPAAGSRYRYRTGSVLRAGRVVDVVRPCGLTLEEVLYDPPCRVGLFMRWRIEPLDGGALVRLDARYRFNHAAGLRFVHWDQRLRLHFGNQLRFIGTNLRRLEARAAAQARNSA